MIRVLEVASWAYFDDAKVAEAIGLEEGKTVAALIPIGFPKFTPDATPRKETADLISYID